MTDYKIPFYPSKLLKFMSARDLKGRLIQATKACQKYSLTYAWVAPFDVRVVFIFALSLLLTG